jgi:sulfate transport system ATP-binding protein
VRPHDLDVTREAEEDARAATVVGVLHLGFEVRVELMLLEGGRATAQLTRERAAELALEPGDEVFIAARSGDRRTAAALSAS